MIQKQEEIINLVTYKIGSIFLIKTKDNGWISEIMFEKFDSNNTLIGTHVISKTGVDYNQFWSDFNTGTYIYQLLADELNVNISNTSFESDFVN